MQTEYDYNYNEQLENDRESQPEGLPPIPTCIIVLISLIGGLIVTWGVYELMEFITKP